MRITHDLALLDLAVFLEEARNLSLAQLGVDASDEQVGARVDGTIVTTVAVIAHLGVLLDGTVIALD